MASMASTRCRRAASTSRCSNIPSVYWRTRAVLALLCPIWGVVVSDLGLQADCRFISDHEREMICRTCAAAGDTPPPQGAKSAGNGARPSLYQSTVAHMGTILGASSSRAIIVAHFACNWNAATVDTYLPQWVTYAHGRLSCWPEAPRCLSPRSINIAVD